MILYFLFFIKNKMFLKNYMQKVSKAVLKFSWLDWSSFEMSVMLFTLFLAVLIPFLTTKVPLWVYFVVFIVPYTYLLWKFFSNVGKLTQKWMIKKLNQTLSKFKIFEWFLYKLCIFWFTLMLVIWAPVLLKLHWIVYLIFYVALSVYLVAHVLHEK